MSVEYDGRTLSAPGLPAVTRTSDSRGRDTAVTRGDGTPIATYEYGDDRIERIELAGGARLVLSPPRAGRVTQTLKGERGQKIRQVVAVGGEQAIRMPVALDLVVRDLALGQEWHARVRQETSASGVLTTLRDQAGRTLLHFVNVGGDRVAFSPDGTALFYDLGIDMHSRDVAAGSDLGTDMHSAEMAGVAPDRLVIARDGRTEAYVSSAASGAINSFWTEVDETGRVVIRHRTMSRPAADQEDPEATSQEPDHDAGPSRDRRLKLTTHYTCFEPYNASVCSYGDGIPMSCSFESGYYEYECGGGTAGVGGGGGGGGSATAAGNQISGDTLLRAAVDRATATAAQKLADTQCQSLLDLPTTGTGPDAILRNTMKNRGYTDPAAYLAEYLRYTNGTLNQTSGDGCDQGAAAWTTVYSRDIRVCSVFKDYGSSMGAVLLIHEMLHSLGLPESPGFPDAESSQQITNRVIAACGS